jgi:hypothetical protein
MKIPDSKSIVFKRGDGEEFFCKRETEDNISSIFERFF